MYPDDILATRKQLWDWPDLGSEALSRSKRAAPAGEATGRVDSVQRLRSSLESADLEPIAGEARWLSPDACAQGD